jgi:nucleoside-diphosphate-sugar epimerase
MNILITGGAGFLGARLARALLSAGEFGPGGAAPRAITRLTLTDQSVPPADLTGDPRVFAVVGELNTLLQASAPGGPKLVTSDTDLVFHLAAAVSGECEADFDLGMRSNFHATHALLEACRRAAHRPVLVFASSLAVFGLTPGESAAKPITDNTLPTPQTSYGIQKFIGEQLVADYTRKGFLRGRSARLMTVAVRPGRPNGAASGFFSGMIREPLAGHAVQVPVSRDTTVALSSPANTVRGLLCAAQVSDDQWGPRTGMNMPALQTSVGAMAEALRRIGGAAAHKLLRWEIDPVIAAIVATWPANVSFERASALGLRADADFATIVSAYCADHPDALKHPIHA